jgi:hypothetical protein
VNASRVARSDGSGIVACKVGKDTKVVRGLPRRPTSPSVRRRGPGWRSCGRFGFVAKQAGGSSSDGAILGRHSRGDREVAVDTNRRSDAEGGGGFGRKAYDRAIQALELHEVHRPADIPLIDAKGLAADQLRELARTLETNVPPVDSGLEASYRETQARLEGVQRSRSSRPLIAGLAITAVLGGVGLGAFANPWIGAAFVLSGAAVFIWLVFRSGDADRTRVLLGGPKPGIANK